jgi:NAD(P)-dependent dehydrogenase (short-subunit alcohol dehydrogenase family)
LAEAVVPEIASKIKRSKGAREMGLLEGRVAIVTGASKGIGRALSLRLAREGAAVVCAARSSDLVEATASQVRAAGGKAIAVVCDAGQQDDVVRMVAAGAKAFGMIDLLVNNAGDAGPTKPVQDYLMEDWRYTIDSCLTSSYLCTRFVVPEMVKAGGGAIVNISSGAGRRGLPYRIGYCAAKAGQVGMTYGMALELAPHNIRVNCVAPGAVEGDRIDQVIAGQAKARGIAVEEMRKTLIARSPLNRMVTAEDIVDATVFLCSDMARNISGQVLAVNAGQPAG